MNRNIWITPIALAGLLSVTSPAYADEDRWYLTGNVGVGNLASTTLTYSDGTTSESDNVSFDASFAGGATIGYRLSNGFSIEGELMYRRNEFDGADLGGFGSFSGGDFASLGLGINFMEAGATYFDSGDVRMEIPSDSSQTLSGNLRALVAIAGRWIPLLSIIDPPTRGPTKPGLSLASRSHHPAHYDPPVW